MPGLAQWRQSRFNRSFEAGQAIGTCRGVFDTLAQAAAAAPTTRPLGYDNNDAAAMYRDRLSRVYPSDYAMMLWLQNAFADGVRSVFDLGGHIGLAYYAYQRVVAFPQDVSWQVNDVPAVLASGREEALVRDPSRRLTFNENFEAAADADLLFTAGCLQYLEESLAQRIAALPRRPRWVLVNLLPLHEQLSFWTVQSIGAAFCPYRIQQKAGFFSDMEKLGYRSLDTWENLDKSCWVAFRPEHTLDRYYGAAFRLE
ncbi:MAG TPA: methyltransferase, TIGR04325 family [Rhizobacter sp.]|nr:methyltransferase, TIGR04325 family [Rhizobacter sp.]